MYAPSYGMTTFFRRMEKMGALKRAGLPGGSCKVLAKGDKRRLFDGRNAWRKMDSSQRELFVRFMLDEGLGDVVEFQMVIVQTFVGVAK
jgi:hypothetical protein